MNKPVCSVIIPAYNCVEYLPIALNSVLIQNAGPVEILVLDDGSSDGSWEYLQQAKAKFPELVTLRGRQIGPSEARNLLISMAKSDLIAFLDADDFWWPQKLKAQISFHQENPAVLFSFSDYLHVDMNNLTHGTAFEYWRPRNMPATAAAYCVIEKPLELLLGCNLVGTSTVMARKDALQNANGFAKEMPSAEDWDLWLRLAAQGEVACSSSVTMSYLQRPGSLTANRQTRLTAMRQIIERYEADAPPEMRKALRQAWSRFHTAAAENHRSDNDYFQAAKSHCAAFSSHPTSRLAKALAVDILSLLASRHGKLAAT